MTAVSLPQTTVVTEGISTWGGIMEEEGVEEEASATQRPSIQPTSPSTRLQEEEEEEEEEHVTTDIPTTTTTTAKAQAYAPSSSE